MNFSTTGGTTLSTFIITVPQIFGRSPLASEKALTRNGCIGLQRAQPG